MHVMDPAPRRAATYVGRHRLPESLRAALDDEPTQAEIRALRARALEQGPPARAAVRPGR